MAFSSKDGFHSRRKRGYKPTKYPKGWDRRGMPIICGIVDEDGNECLNESFYGRCDMHREEQHRKLGLIRERPELFEKRST